MPEKPQRPGLNSTSMSETMCVETAHVCVREVKKEMIYKACRRALAEFLGTVSP